MADDDRLVALLPVARRWVAALHRQDAASLQRIADTLPGGDWIAFATLLGAMVEPDQHPADLLGWTELLEEDSPAARERRRLAELNVDPAAAELLAAQAAQTGDPTLAGLSPPVRAELLTVRDNARARDRDRKRRQRAAAAAPVLAGAESLGDRMLRVSREGRRTA